MLVWNPYAPSDLRQNVLDGAYAGLHPGTLRFVDGSGLGNDSTLVGMTPATDWRYYSDIGRWGNNFLDNTGRIDHADFLRPDTGQVSLSIWLNQQSNASRSLGAWVISQRTNATAANQPNQWQIFYSLTTDYLLATIFLKTDGSSNGTVSVDTTALFQSWFHYAVTAVGGGKAYVYLNGVRTAEMDVESLRVPTACTLGIGREAFGATTRDFKGFLAEPLIYSRALSPAEIAILGNPANRLYIPDTRRVFFVPTDIPSDPPNAPTGLTATAISSSRIDLEWQHDELNTTHYEIQRQLA